MAVRYFKASIPAELAERLQVLIGQHPELGYRSPTQAVNEAVRRFLLDLEERVAVDKAVREAGSVPRRVRERFAHEMVLLAQRYLAKEREAAEGAGAHGKRDRKRPA